MAQVKAIWTDLAFAQEIITIMKDRPFTGKGLSFVRKCDHPAVQVLGLWVFGHITVDLSWHEDWALNLPPLKAATEHFLQNGTAREKEIAHKANIELRGLTIELQKAKRSDV